MFLPFPLHGLGLGVVACDDVVFVAVDVADLVLVVD